METVDDLPVTGPRENVSPPLLIDKRRLSSEVVLEIVSRKPDFFIRSGTTVFVITFGLLVTACWFIKYPDVIYAAGKLSSFNAPKPVISLTDGKLIRIMMSEAESVSKGRILGYVEATADHDQVIKLSGVIDTIQLLLSTNQADRVDDYFRQPFTELGELQSSYQTFAQSLLYFRSYLANGFYLKKKKMLQNDMFNLKKSYTNLLEQKRLQELDLSLTQETFDANESLRKDNVISDFDYRSEQSKLILKKLALPQIEAAIISNENLQSEKQKEMLELENTINQQKLIFQEATSTLKSQIDAWKKKYLLVAPIDGKVAFASFIQENQQLQLNQTICYINPKNSKYYAEINIPQINFGKAAVGQQVLLKFDSYPFQEYGYVKGKIEFISDIPVETGYFATVGLPNGLSTTYNKQLQYRSGLLANAEIITTDMRLLERFYYNIARQIRR